MAAYFAHCSEIVRKWRERGSTCLEGEMDVGQPGHVSRALGAELTNPHGVYLFRHRNMPIQYFPPNFHPPYDSLEKRKIIQDVLSRKWNEHNLQWD